MKKRMRIVIWIGILTGLFLLICGNAAAEEMHPVNPNYSETAELAQRMQEQLESQSTGGRRGAPTLTVAINGEKSEIIDAEHNGVPCDNLTFTATLTGVDHPEEINYIWLIHDRVRDVEDDVNGTTYRPNTSGLTGNNTIQYFFYSAGSYLVYVEAWQGGTCIAKKTNAFIIDDDDEHLTIEEKAQEIVNANRGATDWETALNLHDWLTHHAYYDYTYSRYGADMLFTGTGVCDSYSKDYLLLLNTAGITAQRVTGTGHAWNAIQLGDEWYHIDVTWDDSGDATVPVSGKESHDYFCINDELIFGIMDQGNSHQNSSFTGCTSLEASWPIRTGEWRNNGLYWDEDELYGEIKDYRDLFLASIPSEGGTFTVSADHEYPIGGYYFSPAYDWTVMVARYFYAYGLSRTGIELANGNLLELNIVYNLDADEPLFTITIDDINGTAQKDGEGLILRYDGMRLADGDAVGGKIQYKFYVENIPEGCTKLQFEWTEDMHATAPIGGAGGWGDDWRELQSDQGGTFFYVMPDILGNYNSEIMFVRTGSDAPARRIVLYYNRTPVDLTPITFTNATAPGYQEQGYTLTWSEAEGADFYYAVWEKPGSDRKENFAGPEGLALARIPGATNAYGKYKVTVFAIENDRILQKSATWSFWIIDGSAEQPQAYVEPFFIGGYEELQIGVRLGEYATQAYANLDRNTSGDEEDFVFDEWVAMERSEGAEDEGYDGYIDLFPENLEPGAYRLYVDFYDGEDRFIRISKEIGNLEFPYDTDSRIELPDDLSEIEEEAFTGTQAQVVIIGNNGIKIRKRAFANSDIRYIVIERFAENIEIEDEAFEECNVQVVFGFDTFAEELAEELHAYYCDISWSAGNG